MGPWLSNLSSAVMSLAVLYLISTIFRRDDLWTYPSLIQPNHLKPTHQYRLILAIPFIMLHFFNHNIMLHVFYILKTLMFLFCFIFIDSLIKEAVAHGVSIFLFHCVYLYVCRVCINFQDLCAGLLGDIPPPPLVYV